MCSNNGHNQPDGQWLIASRIWMGEFFGLIFSDCSGYRVCGGEHIENECIPVERKWAVRISVTIEKRWFESPNLLSGLTRSLTMRRMRTGRRVGHWFSLDQDSKNETYLSCMYSNCSLLKIFYSKMMVVYRWGRKWTKSDLQSYLSLLVCRSYFLANISKACWAMIS